MGKTIEVSKEIAEEVYRLHGVIAIMQSRLALAIDTMANAEGCVLAQKGIRCPADYVTIGCHGCIKRYVEGAGE